MDNFRPKSQFVSKVLREVEQTKKEHCHLSPFKAQNIVYEVLKNHLMTNKPKDLGFTFDEVYDPDETKSKIFIDLSNNWKTSSPQKRPAVFVYRGEANYETRGGALIGANVIGRNVAESEESYMRTCSMPIILNCIHGPIGAIETFAEYIRYPFLYFSKEITSEYCFKKFRVSSITAPALVTEDAKDAFSVRIIIDVEFTESWLLKGDHLKLKAVQFAMYNDLTEKPLESQ